MQFTPQQMAGYKGYSSSTLIGNWYEDIQVKEDKLRAFQAAGANNGGMDPIQMMNARVNLHPAKSDGFVRFDSVVQVKSLVHGGTDDQSLAVDTTPKRRPKLNHTFVSLSSSNAPTARAAWCISKTRDTSNNLYDRRGEADILHYGQLFRLVNEFGFAEGSLYLCSEKMSASTQSRGGKQLISAGLGASSDCNFIIEAVNDSATDGDPVRIGDAVIIRHAMTRTPLFADETSRVVTVGGTEMEVSGHLAKMQATKGTVPQLPCNHWTIVAAPVGSVYKAPAHIPPPTAVLDRVKARILERAGGNGFRGIVRSLRLMDKSGNFTLSRPELKEGMTNYGVVLTTAELDVVFKLFDRNGDGTISITEFLRTLRGDMTARRERLVKDAFRCIDTDDSGVATFEELRGAYSNAVSRHPAVINGSKTEEQVIKDFVSAWDKSGDAKVTLEEFIEYYADLSCNIDNDDYFELMIRNAWHMSGGEGWAQNTTCKRVLVVHNDDSEEVIELINDLGLDVKDIKAVTAKLVAQGVTDIKRVALT